MRAAFQLFENILNDNSKTMATYDYLNDHVRPPYDYSDLLRWQWTQAVSALDKLIHDLIRVGLKQEYLGQRSRTGKFLTLAITMNTYFELQSTTEAERIIIFEKYVTEKNRSLSFQDPDKISDGLSLISDVQHKWQQVATALSDSEINVRTKLKNISIRRNQIVHEGDYPNPNADRQEILKEDVEEVNKFILDIGTAIFNLVK